MARPDANVQRFVKENDTAARNEAMLSTMHATQQVSAWHEKQYHKTGGATVGGREMTSNSPSSPRREARCTRYDGRRCARWWRRIT